MDHSVWVYFWALCLVTLTSVSAFVPCFDHCSFEVVWNLESWNFQLCPFSRLFWQIKLQWSIISHICSVNFSSVAQMCLILCDLMNHSTPGLPVHHQLLGSTQTHVHWVCDDIQQFHSQSSPSPPTFNLSQHQGLFQWVSSLHQVAKLLEFQLQHQSFQWTPRTDPL